MTIFYDDNIERIDELLIGSEALFRKRFLETIQQIEDTHTLEEIIEYLENDQIDEALVAAELAAANIGFAYSTSYTRSAQKTAEFISNSISILVNFDQTNETAVEQMRANQLRIIRNFTEKQKLATKLALLDGIRRGLNPRQQALLFKMSIGLTEEQVQWVINFRKLLEELDVNVFKRLLRDKRFDATLHAAIESSEPLTSAQIDRMVERYRSRVLTYRSETIARTEALTAVHQGVDNMYIQAIEDGVLDEDSLEQTWHTASDERIRGSHKPMHLQKRRIGEAFLSGLGNALRYPGDPQAPVGDRINCRCMKTTRFRIVTGLAA
jgi:hypothetical protein